MTIPAGCEARCRACAHRAYTPAESLKQKEGFLKSRLEDYPTLIEPIRSTADIWGYRTKSTLHAAFKEGRWCFGTMAHDEVIPIPLCPVHAPQLNRAFEFLSKILPPDLPLAFVSIAGELATLVIKAHHYEFREEIRWEDSGLRGVWACFHPSAGRRVTSSHGWKRIWGEGEIKHDGFWYGPSSFQQQLGNLHQDALEEARKFLNPSPQSLVIDLYSGTGRSVSIWRDCGASVVGVELGGEAVRLADKNVGDGLVLRGRASERIPQLQQKIQPDLLTLCYANPPRTGLEPEVIHWLVNQSRPRRIAYLSCSPGTLSKNLLHLTQAGYALRRIIPYDFFPRTQHIEALALLDLDASRVVRLPLG